MSRGPYCRSLIYNLYTFLFMKWIVLFSMQSYDAYTYVIKAWSGSILLHFWIILQKYLDEADELKKKYIEEMKIFKESDAYKNVMKKKRKASGNVWHNKRFLGLYKTTVYFYP